MQRMLTGDRRLPFRIGLGYGLVAGVVGIGQWILTEQDLATRINMFHKAQLRDPSFFDSTFVVRGNEWFWIGTAAEACGVALLIYVLAAFTASLISQRQQDGIFAAWVAAGVGGTLYIAAAILARLLGPDPVVTDTLTQCELVYALVLFTILFPLAIVSANIGIFTRRTFSHHRRA